MLGYRTNDCHVTQYSTKCNNLSDHGHHSSDYQLGSADCQHMSYYRQWCHCLGIDFTASQNYASVFSVHRFITTWFTWISQNGMILRCITHSPLKKMICFNLVMPNLKLLGQTRPILQMLMPRLLASPRHQAVWYWLDNIVTWVIVIHGKWFLLPVPHLCWEMVQNRD